MCDISKPLSISPVSCAGNIVRVVDFALNEGISYLDSYDESRKDQNNL